jgi:hypothetical protein
MDFLQNIDGGSVLLLTLACASICGIVVVLFFGLQIIGTALGFLTGILEFFSRIISGGPISWCGCLVVILGCGFCTVSVFSVASILQTCGTPEAVNFCSLLGY